MSLQVLSASVTARSVPAVQTVHVPLPALGAGLDPPVLTGVYEGPLDLLLLLIRREGVDVREIPLALICDRYLWWLEGLEAGGEGINVEVAGDYLVLAATLCQLKARELLPPAARSEREAEEVDPGEALVQRLLEYARYQEAAASLGALELLDREVFARCPSGPSGDQEGDEPDPPADLPVDGSLGAMGIGLCYAAVLERLRARDVVHAVEAERFSLAATLQWLRGRLVPARPVPLQSLFSQLPDRRQRLHVLLALLEMARREWLDLRQDGQAAPQAGLPPVLLCLRRRVEEEELMALQETV